MAIKFLDEEQNDQQVQPQAPQMTQSSSGKVKFVDNGDDGISRTLAGAEEIRRAPSGLRTAGQIVGGVTGGAAGAAVGRPLLGETAGATLGRTLGTLEEFVQRREEDMNPLEKVITSAIPRYARPVAAFAMMDLDRKKELGREMFYTGAWEGIASVAFGGAKELGKGALKGLLGRRVAERGINFGFGKILDPKFFKGRT